MQVVDRMLERGIPTGLAMMITGRGRELQAQVNNAASRGYYSPPAADPGVARRWRWHDQIGLMIFRDLRRLELKLEVAANRANLARGLLEDHPAATTVTVNLSGNTETLWSDAHGELDTPEPVTTRLTFDVEAIRQTIRSRLSAIFDADPEEFQRLWSGPQASERVDA